MRNTVRPFDPLGDVRIELGATKLNTIALEHRANQIVPGGRNIRTTGTSEGTIIKAIPQRPNAPEYLPFEISITTIEEKVGDTYVVKNAIRAEAGQVGDFTIAKLIKNFDFPAADATWYLQAKVVIDASTGEITSGEVDWVDTEGTDTATDYFQTIGSVDITDGAPNPETVQQFNYGPLFLYVYGDVLNVWTVSIV